MQHGKKLKNTGPTTTNLKSADLQATSIHSISSSKKINSSEELNKILQLNIELQQKLDEYQHLADALRESEEKFRSIVETTKEMIWAIDTNGVHTYVNPAHETLLGYKPEELVGRDGEAFNHKDDWLAFKEKLPLLINERTGWNNIIFRWKHKDGSYRYVESNAVPIFDKNGEVIGFRGADRDITERKQEEERAKQHELERAHLHRIRLMGEISSTLAHELNQPLAAITNYLNGCLNRLKSGNYQVEQLTDVLQMAVQQSVRAGEFINRMKDFASKGKLLYENTDINLLIKEMTALNAYTCQELNVTTKLNLSNEIPILNIDKIQIETVVLNLFRNSLDALRQAEVKQPIIIINSIKVDDTQIKIQLIDNGPGFTPELAKKLFNPYFTTKTQGTGLGLAICRTIVEAHGGNISAKQAPEGGACFEFTLPINKVRIKH